MAAHPEIMTNAKPDVLVVRFEAGMDMATAGKSLSPTSYYFIRPTENCVSDPHSAAHPL